MRRTTRSCVPRNQVIVVFRVQRLFEYFFPRDILAIATVSSTEARHLNENHGRRAHLVDMDGEIGR